MPEAGAICLDSHQIPEAEQGRSRMLTKQQRKYQEGMASSTISYMEGATEVEERSSIPDLLPATARVDCVLNFKNTNFAFFSAHLLGTLVATPPSSCPFIET